MVELGLLALMAALSVGTFFLPHGDSDNDDKDEDTPVEEPQETQAEGDVLDTGAELIDETQTEAEVLDTGAEFKVTQTGVDIQVGADETRSLAVVYFMDTQDDPDDFILTDEARFYLVPEDVDWSGANWENQYLMPDAENEEDELYKYNLSEFEEHYGLELIATVDLKGVSDDVDAPADRIGEVTSNVPISGYYLEAITDGDELVTFLPEDYVELRNGLAQQTVTSDTVATDEADWIYAEGDGLSLDGAGGDDILEADGDDVLIVGGAGDDSIEAAGANSTIIAGSGEDEVISYGGEVRLGGGNDYANPHDGESTVYGGSGDDRIIANEGANVLYGEGGDDRLFVRGEGSVARGGSGDDSIFVGNSAIGYGGAGNDELKLESGGTGDGGAGNDLFTVMNFFHADEGGVVITTGEGQDTIDAAPRSVYGGEADDIYMRITDFDPEEDILQLSSYSSDDEGNAIEIVEAEDGTYTDVRVTYEANYGAEAGIVVIRLDGTPGITEDQIVFAA